MKQNKAAVLLLAHGSPESLDDVPEFVRHITGGRPLPEAILEEVRYRYSRIGKSPLTEITMAQAQEVQRELGLPVYVGMRNWKPFVAEAVRQMLNAGVEQVLAI
ncbi:MAG TPA: ferrochelatase, partial [Candidatus Angelobacter sp.]|nr:ferrochelatase [Candidatus Angelobacter sp.]